MNAPIFFGFRFGKLFSEDQDAVLTANSLWCSLYFTFFREIDNPSSYGEFVEKTAPALDLQNSAHCAELLKWLNRWNCRIALDRFSELCSRLRKWAAEQNFHTLPQGIAMLDDSHLDQLTSAYDGLRGCGLGATPAGKSLFAACPTCAIPWDEEIRTEFVLGENSSGYRGMLKVSREEANILLTDASRLGIPDVFNAIGSPAYTTLPKLLDEYHWITITRGHHIPSKDELEQWIPWVAK